VYAILRSCLLSLQLEVAGESPIDMLEISGNLKASGDKLPHILLIGGVSPDETVGADLLTRFARHLITGSVSMTTTSMCLDRM